MQTSDPYILNAILRLLPAGLPLDVRHVTTKILVGADGAVKKVRVLAGLPNGIMAAVVEQAYRTHYKPATKDGSPIECWIQETMSLSGIPISR